jgi:hypothetical protein
VHGSQLVQTVLESIKIPADRVVDQIHHRDVSS